MSSPTHEHLLGYILGALEPWEHEQLEREIAADPELAQQVRELAARIAPLEHGRPCDAPPPGLANRTCEFIFDAECVPEHEKVSRRNAAMSPTAELSGNYSSWSWDPLESTCRHASLSIL